MEKTGMTRRFFIGGLGAVGAATALRAFADPCGKFATGKPRMSFGVVSDIHIRLRSLERGAFAPGYDTAAFETALRYFRDSGVDAVVIPGDLADRGLGAELREVADSWRRVFPDDRAPDGRKVERVFIFGNHDNSGMTRGEAVIADRRTLAGETLERNARRFWDECFGEDWREVYWKTVKGYRFVAAHWCIGDWRGQDEHCNDGIPAFYAAHGHELDPRMPFFHVQHPHPKDTCYGPKAWGRDDGTCSSVLNGRPNAIALSGHSHHPLTDERTIWQGAYTSVGCGSLRYAVPAYGEHEPHGFENTTRITKAADRAEIDGNKILPTMNTHDSRQGMLVAVHEDRIVFHRRDMTSGAGLGDDWVMPLPAAEPRPFAFAARAAAMRAPQFPEGAKLEKTEGEARTRGFGNVARRNAAFVGVRIPAATGDKTARVLKYEVTIVADDGQRTVRHLAAPGGIRAADDARCRETCEFRIARDRLPKSEGYRFEVVPIGSFGKRGKALSA